MAALITTGCLKTSGQLAAGRICMVNVLPKDQRAGCAALEEPEYCNPLFGIEQELAGQSPEERYEQPLAPSKPVMDALLVWAEMKSAAAPKSALGRALYYLREQWPYLIRYLEDGRLELSNNRAERSIKPFVMGRKNWLFSNTPAGAQSSAVIYSLIETAKENDLDPCRYLVWLLNNAPGLSQTDEAWAESFLPVNAPQ
mgnify:CR=1 FL=1